MKDHRYCRNNKERGKAASLAANNEKINIKNVLPATDTLLDDKTHEKSKKPTDGFQLALVYLRTGTRKMESHTLAKEDIEVDYGSSDDQ